MNFLPRVAELAVFAPEKMQKVTCHDGARLLVGLNCFEPGQSQTAHTHAGEDKFYLVLSGKARFEVGAETRDAAAGDEGGTGTPRVRRGRARVSRSTFNLRPSTSLSNPPTDTRSRSSGTGPCTPTAWGVLRHRTSGTR